MDKFKSRKFWITILTAVAGTATSIIAIGGKIGQVGTVISIILPPIIYVIIEGTIDAKAAGMAVEATKEVVRVIKEARENDNDAVGEEVSGKTN